MAEMEIRTFDYSQNNYDSWILPFDYHCLYILENGKEAYIGETKDVRQRSEEHKREGDVCFGYKFPRIHVLTGKTFEETPAKHFETLLIRLMRADGKFRILNSRTEWQHYFRKNEFELCFDRIWFQLERLGLVCHKDFQEVLNLSQYKFSPNVPLTQAQHDALTSIVHTIDSQETLPHKEGFLSRPILVSGDPGSGKTVVATSLFYYLRTREPYKNWKIGLVYASSATRDEIQEVFKTVPGLKKKDVISPIAAARKNYDIVICDEAHRLRRAKNAGRYYSNRLKGMNRILGLDESCDELDWILKCSKYQILFYDAKQSVCPSDIPSEDFKARLYTRQRGVRPIELKEQLRIRAGSEYVPYIYDVLFQKAGKAKSFSQYDFRLFESFDEMYRQMKEKEQAVGLCRLCGGYAWKWNKDTPEEADIHIQNTSIWWNRQTGGWLRNPGAREEMGSIYTLPGLDLNYAMVVIGPEVFYDVESGCIKIDMSHFYDNKVKLNTSEEDIRRFVLNTYAVFMTRGIIGTYVYACDEGLRSYLRQYIPV
ncbi:MAG: DUF2075 domain-containing protein [Acetatifactor sp.]|nr:DUF2075 domain-containing protein [Acetatifactor sp.]